MIANLLYNNNQFRLWAGMMVNKHQPIILLLLPLVKDFKPVYKLSELSNASSLCEESQLTDIVLCDFVPFLDHPLCQPNAELLN